jgi:tetratricopeptide (TPR) repeat protein
MIQEPDADAFVERGNAWRDKKDYDRAIQNYEEAIRVGRDRPPALL